MTICPPPRHSSIAVMSATAVVTPVARRSAKLRVRQKTDIRQDGSTYRPQARLTSLSATLPYGRFAPVAPMNRPARSVAPVRGAIVDQPGAVGIKSSADKS